MQLCNSEMESFLCLLNDFLDGKLKTVCIPLFPCKRTELAAQNAVIGIINVTIEDVTGAVADFALPGQIGKCPKHVQLFALKQTKRLLIRNALSRSDLFVKITQWAALDEKLHGIRLPERRVLANLLLAAQQGFAKSSKICSAKSMAPEISVIVPLWNERLNVIPLIEQIFRAFAKEPLAL